MSVDAATPMRMEPDLSLLDYLADRMGKPYLSDLIYDSAADIRRAVQSVPACALPLEDWLDAIRYFFRDAACVPTSPQGARASLLDLLGARGA